MLAIYRRRRISISSSCAQINIILAQQLRFTCCTKKFNTSLCHILHAFGTCMHIAGKGNGTVMAGPIC